MNSSQIQKIKNLIEAILRIKGGRGYAAGTAIPVNNPRPGLGRSEYEYEPKKKENDSLEPVDVSRAFKKEEENE